MMAESNTGEVSGHVAAVVVGAAISNNKRDHIIGVSETQHMKEIDDMPDETEWYGEEESRIEGT